MEKDTSPPNSSQVTSSQANSSQALSSVNGQSQHSVLIVEGESIICEALKTLFNSYSGYHVVGVARNCDEALSQLDLLQPKVLTTEVHLSGKSGIELIREVKRRKLDTRCVVLSSCSSPAVVKQAFSCGAISYVLKSDSVDSLLAGFTATLRNTLYTSKTLAHLGATSAGFMDPEDSNLDDPLLTLSPREREIFYFLADGKQNADIARTLFISPRTVETHRARVVRKLGLKSNAEIIRYAIKSGLVTL